MAIKLTEEVIKGLEVPKSGYRIYYDDKVTGFGVRIGTTGRPVYILNIRVNGAEKRITIAKGYRHRDKEAMSLKAARDQAKVLIGQIKDGQADVIEARKTARTMNDLWDEYERDALPRLRPSSQSAARHYVRTYINPVLDKDAPETLATLRDKPVASVTLKDVEKLLAVITRERGPYIANRVVGFLSVLFSKAIRWGWCKTNPTVGVERNREHRRENFIKDEQVAKLVKVLDEYEDKTVARIVKILLLTGARKSEVFGMRWDELDLDARTWSKAPERTKQARRHTVPISEDVRAILLEVRKEAKADAVFVFPGRGKAPHRKTIHKDWVEICLRAELVKISQEDGKTIVRHSLRVHDLRHSYASFLVSAGLGLEVIGRLLGHSSMQTTSRYAHLHEAALRRATELGASTIATAAKGGAA